MRRLVVLFLLWGVPALAADRYDALIVLGGGGPPEGWANPVLVERVCKAVRERAAGRAERLVMTGGYTTGHIAEAEMMRAVAVAMGVPAKDVLIEPSSVSTAENAAFMLRLARTANIHKAALVSHRSHFPRARETFERAGGGWWTDLGVIEADGALSSPCFPRVEPLALGSTVDMLITDVTEDESVDELINRPADVPTRRLVEEVLAAGQAYEAGLARRLYFVEPTASTPTVIGSRGFARGHISRTELARVLATAYGVAFDSIYISSARRFGQIPGAVEPADAPWARIPHPKLAVAAPAFALPWWRDRLSRGVNADLPPPRFLEEPAAAEEKCIPPPGLNVHAVEAQAARGCFWRGAAPRLDTLAALAKEAEVRGSGVTLVDLRHPDTADDRSGKDQRLSPSAEAQEAARLGLRYISISALDASLIDVLRTALRRGGVYMHCMYGVNRTGFAAARYSRAEQIRIGRDGLGERDWRDGDAFQSR